MLRAVACVLAAVGVHGAIASPVYSISSPEGFVPVLFEHYTTRGNADTVSSSLANKYLNPNGSASTVAYVYASTWDGVIDVTKLQTTTFSFLWGSPDLGNTITYHTSVGDFTYTGVDLTADFGQQDDNLVFTARFDNAATIDGVTFTSRNVAFEVDGVQQRVPEPGSVALVSAALGTLAWTTRRRRTTDKT